MRWELPGRPRTRKSGGRTGVLAVLLAGVGAAFVAGCAAPGAGVDVEALRTRAAALFGTVDPTPAQEVKQPVAVLGRALFWDRRLSLDGKTIEMR